MKLELGVLEVAYSDAKNGQGETTTFQVAEILEKNYAVMETFFESRKEQIAQWLADDMASSLQDLIDSGGGINTGIRVTSASHKVGGVKRIVSGEQSGTYTYGADQRIEAAFRSFIFGSEMAKMRGGVISAAAQAGKSKRFKSGHTPKRKERPAFVDTGLYVSSFRSWTEE
ncbi:MAG: hypothetical protein ACYDCJ_12515 [Gammaproteobacteria bacterium]